MRTSLLGIIVAASLATACGRTPLLPPTCMLQADAQALDFGDVEPGGRSVRSVTLTNLGQGMCSVPAPTMGEGTDPAFSVAGMPRSPMLVSPGQTLTLSLSFAPTEAWPPLARKGTLVIKSNDPIHHKLEVPLAGRIASQCTLSVSPSSVDFGHVALDATVAAVVHLASTGKGPCAVAGIAMAAGSDGQFSLAASTSLALHPGDAGDITIVFHAVEHAPPHHRTGELVFQTTDPGQPTVRVPIAADIDVGCWLTWTPASLDFGKLTLNTSATRELSLGNEGTAPCQVDGIMVSTDSATGFSLLTTQPSPLTVGADGQASIVVRFDAFDSTPPHDKRGTLVFATGNPHAPQAAVPLSALIDTTCEESGRWIYTVSNDSMLARLNPTTGVFTDIAQLDCPINDSPNSMAVDQHGFAWVAYQSGALFKVDITTGKCEPTTYRSGQHGLVKFGMGFVFDPATGIDTLYIAGGESISPSDCTLATLDFPSLVVTPVGTITEGSPELTGTGDGELWGFMPVSASASKTAMLVRLDPKTAKSLETHNYTSLADGDSWAVKFWGGYFWIFLDDAVYRLPRDTMEDKDLVTVIAHSGRYIVGAGVSTCAPIKKAN